MKIKDITYIDFLLLPEDERLAYHETCNAIEPFNVDCNKWKWGDVKWVQDGLIGDISYLDILDIAKKEGRKLSQTSQAHVVINMFNSIRKSIEAISAKEAELLAHENTPKEHAASEAVGGFARFGTLPQTLSLVGVLAPSMQEVEEIDYGTAFMALWYKKIEADFQKQLYKK